jgi:hypothetical protein
MSKMVFRRTPISKQIKIRIYGQEKRDDGDSQNCKEYARKEHLITYHLSLFNGLMAIIIN